MAAPGAPRQADLRRSISSSYYALFHFVVSALADEFIGFNARRTARYALVYRSLDHRPLRDICLEVIKPTPSRRFLQITPSGGFATGLQAFAAVVAELQQRRHDADYDPQQRFFVADAQHAHREASAAISRFHGVDDDQRKLFLTLLLCPPR